MQEATETITVINHKLNTETGLDDWIPTTITGASWYSKVVSSVTSAGLKAANTATVRIPVDADTDNKEYVTPAAYKAAVSVSGAFTLATGDLIVRGTVTVGSAPLTPAKVQETYTDCYTIIGVTDNTRRPREPHWKVMGA